jgi:hypothetical protein
VIWRKLKAALMLEKGSSYEIVSLPENGSHKLLVLERRTETGELFRVVAGYYLGQKERYPDDSSLVQIELVPLAEYSRIKTILRGMASEEKRKAPITFW